MLRRWNTVDVLPTPPGGHPSAGGEHRRSHPLEGWPLAARSPRDEPKAGVDRLTPHYSLENPIRLDFVSGCMVS